MTEQYCWGTQRPSTALIVGLQYIRQSREIPGLQQILFGAPRRAKSVPRCLLGTHAIGQKFVLTSLSRHSENQFYKMLTVFLNHPQFCPIAEDIPSEHQNSPLRLVLTSFRVSFHLNQKHPLTPYIGFLKQFYTNPVLFIKANSIFYYAVKIKY